MAKDYDAFATENKGIFRIGSVDCDEQPQICTKEKVTSFPSIKVYPPFPMPVSDADVSKGVDAKALRNMAGKFITDKSIEITSNNHQTFVSEDVQTPKVLLFTNAKKGTPFIFKALSQHFEKTLQFGLIREGDDALAKKYGVKKYPALYVIKAE
jgi:hypothetical protein